MVPGGCCSHGCHVAPSGYSDTLPKPIDQRQVEMENWPGKTKWTTILHVGYHITYYVVQIPQQFIQQMPNFIQYMLTQYNSSIHVSFITLCTACLPSYYNYYRLTGTYMYSVIWILNHCSKLSVKEQWKHYEPALLFWPSGRLRKCKKDQFGTM